MLKIAFPFNFFFYALMIFLNNFLYFLNFYNLFLKYSQKLSDLIVCSTLLEERALDFDILSINCLELSRARGRYAQNQEEALRSY